MAEPLRLGIAGLGTVGGGVIKIIQAHTAALEKRTGRGLEITAVSARDASKDRGVDLSSYDWVDNALDLASRDDVDVVVEMIGGSEGLAKDLVEEALKNGKHVVTANKALLAHHGFALAQMAEENGVSLAYEAAVAGGIPVIKAVREGFAGNDVSAVYGILNGTCNYILSQMYENGGDFEVILKEAQDLGYAEADPSFDVDGIDAAHKICLLASIAFGVKPDFDALKVSGISAVSSADITFAEEFGYRIKLLGIAKRLEGKALQVVEPCLVPELSKIGNVEDVFNAVMVEGDFVDSSLLIGRGAGEGPTASSVLSDIVDIARGINVPVFGVSASDLQDAQWVNPEEMRGRYYVRLNVLDHEGVLADVTGILRDSEVSIESTLQRGATADQPVHLAFITHETSGANISKACKEIQKLEANIDEPCLMRVEGLE